MQYSLSSSSRLCLLLNILLPALFVVAGLSIMASAATAQALAVNPLQGQSRAAYAGGVLFRAQCATCHGADARGIDSIDAPDLTQMWSQRDYSDARVFAIIRQGLPGTIMPPHGFTDTEIWMLVTYLRSVAVTGVRELPAGNVMRGRRLFADQCADCHRVGQFGGILGPNLSNILQRQSLTAITQAVRAPQLAVNPDFKTVDLITAEGRRLRGVLRNEDAFSVQMIDEGQRLQAFKKSELAELRFPDVSLMPAFANAQLSTGELADILNFIEFVHTESGQ